MPDWKRIRQAVWHPTVAHLREAGDEEAHQSCNCLPASAGGTSCRTSECVNRGCQMECARSLCPCGEECMNQAIQRQALPSVECATGFAPDRFQHWHDSNSFRASHTLWLCCQSASTVAILLSSTRHSHRLPSYNARVASCAFPCSQVGGHIPMLVHAEYARWGAPRAWGRWHGSPLNPIHWSAST